MDPAGRNPSPGNRQSSRPRSSRAATPASAPGLRRRERSETIPLSHAQQRLWFLEQLEPGAFAYNLPQAIRMEGRLDRDALRRTLQALAARHESLRTSFPTVEGGPIQVIAPEAEIGVPTLDLTNMPAAQREGEAAAILRAEAQRPFDLAHGPLFRAGLLRLSEEQHVLFWTMHHIVADGWSMRILVEELAAFYEEFSGGRRAELPELPVQYSDFGAWQREWLSGEVLDEHLSYWRKQLSGIPVLELPTDRPRPPVQSLRGARASVSFSSGLTEGLKEVSRREGATLSMTLLAAFGALLGRYTGQQDLVVGSPIAGRNRAEIEGLVGLFVNTLVLRTDLSGNPSFRDLLHRVRKVELEAHAHQDLPFEKLVEELQPERSLGHNPLFQVLFALQTASPVSFERAGLKVTSQPTDTGTTRFDLEVHLRESANALSCTLEYSTDLFDGSTIRRMLGHFQNLLESVVADPDRRLSALSLMSDGERRQVLVEWNETEREYPREATVHGLFEGQVERTPEAEALVFGRERLTYRQLNERANRLAGYLKRRGVGPEVLVGVCVERSLELVVGLLGILKAGGAYVPLDPIYPPGRVEFMLEDSGARVVLTQASLSGSLPEGELERLCLDADCPEIARESAENPSGGARAENRAYVLYTSGSTGTPKGVEIEHHSTVALLAWARQQFGQGELDGVLASTSVCFDLSVFELFAPLVWGGKVILSRDALELPELPAACEVKLVNTVPSVMAELLRIGGLPESVSTVNLAGEPLSASLVNEILESGAGRRVFDLYGPTEDTTYSTCARRSPDGPVTIGRPISNKRVYLLDEHLAPVPIGVTGEVYVAGAGVARGYLNRPEMTADKFLADPFRKGSERMYRTGDRGRFLPDGQIQFLGRTDHQVKIRGYRIEIGEIEQALGRLPEIQACAVAVWEVKSGDKRLVGYVVPRNGSSPSVTRLRGFLKSTLPDYMVPSTFLFLDALPTTPNGKLDRRALPAPQQTRPALEDLFVAPRTPVEETVAGIWRQVLGLDRIGVDDNFFELGGHSLLAVRLFAEIEKAFGRSLPLATLFQAPTVEGLAERLRQEGWEAPWSSLVVIQGGKGRPPFLCVPGVGGNILGFYDLARQLGPDQPVYGLQAQGLDGKRDPLTRVEDMAAHYIREIRAVLPDGPFLLGGASFGGKVAFEMARQLDAAGIRVSLVALFDAFAPGETESSSRLKGYAARLKYHARNLLLAARRGDYVVRKSRTLRRRIQSRVWQLIYESYRSRAKPLPRILKDVQEAGYLASRKYSPAPYRGKVTLFRAEVRPVVDAATADMGWSRLALGGVEIREVPGGHIDMLLRPKLGLLAEQLRECIDNVVRDRGQVLEEEAKGVVSA